MRDKSVTHDFHALGMEKERSFFQGDVSSCPAVWFPQEAHKTGSAEGRMEPILQIALSSRQRALGSALTEFADGFVETSKPCFGRFGSLD